MHTYLNSDEAADYLRLKKSTLYSFVHQRRIPYRKTRETLNLLSS